ncbi:hypothetical protein BDF21DRAFT_163435 [Thamnidium elegans]|nr:hypothetical protein BDF21DRAFT_163435 [Thamnidium elegans]
MSPAITPNYTEIYEFLDPPSDQYFTPLSSPALPPSTNNSLNDNSPTTSTLNLQNATLLSQQLAQIEAKQQLLRDQLNKPPTSPVAYRKSPLASFSNRFQAPPSPLPFNAKKRPSLRQKIALASPQLHAPQNRPINNNNNNTLPTTPATPASLMKMTHQRQIPTTTTTTTHINNTFTNSTINNEMIDIMFSLPPTVYTSVNESTTTTAAKKRKLAPSSPVAIASSPRTLKPLISPFLPPDNNKSVFMPTIENRRSAHKVAEQRRRDTLKQSFDSLRKEITDVLIMDTVSFENEEKKRSEEAIRDEKEKEVKLMSKVLLLQHSYEYIVKLKSDGKLKDEKIESMQSELDKLRLLANNKE